MKRKVSLLDAFGIEENETPVFTNYEVFGDKVFLEELKDKLIRYLIENNMLLEDAFDSFMKSYQLTDDEKKVLFNLVNDEISGYGPLTELINDKNITEIMVNGPKDIFVIMNGRIIKEKNISFINNEHIVRTVLNILKSNNKSVSKDGIISYKLNDNVVINAILPPISVNSPVVNIKKNNLKKVLMDDLIRTGTLTPYMARFLEACVLGKLNILITGKVRSGKTTLLKVLSNFISDKEILATILDNSELCLDNAIKIDKNTLMDTNDLIESLYNVRVNRLLIDELNYDFTKYLFDSSMLGVNVIGIIKAKDGISGLYRIKSLSSLNNDMIYSSIDLVINLEKFDDDRIKVTSISELDKSSDNLALKDIFVFKKDKSNEKGEFIRYDFYPKVVTKLKLNGISDIDYIFINPGDKNGKRSTN